MAIARIFSSIGASYAIREAEVVRLVGRRDDGLGEGGRALAALLETGVDLGRVRAVLDGEPADELELLGRVRRELVHGHDGVQPEVLHDPDVPGEVGGAPLDHGHAAVDVAAVVLEGAHRRDEHRRVRTQAADPARDVEELLHPHVRAEARLGDQVLAEL